MLVLAAAVCAVAIGSGCANDAKPASLVVRVGRSSDAITLDPARATENDSSEVVEQIFDTLVRYRPDSTEVEPSLAMRWESSEMGRAWTFHLRENVVFHDGTPVDADAIVFSFERQRDADHPFHRNDFTYWENTFRTIISSVEKIDAKTVRIVLEKPYAPFLATLAMFPVSIVSPTAVKKWGDDFGKHPVGSGPFRFAEWSPGERITLEGNTAYWDGAPKIASLVFATIADARQRLVALEGGAIEVAERLAPQDLQFVVLHPDLVLHRTDGLNIAYLAMNVKKPLLDNVLVRRAINHAVNKQAIVKLVYQGLARPATTPLPPSFFSHVTNDPYPESPSRAQELLAEAKLKKEDQRPLKLYVMSSPRAYMPSPLTVARIIQHNLADIGLEVELVVNDFDTHLKAVRRGDHDLCLLGWNADNGDPDNVLFTLFDSTHTEEGRARNVAFYENPIVHGLLQWAQESQLRAEREDYYRRAQIQIQTDAPWVPLAHSQLVIASKRKLAGLRVHPTNAILYRLVGER